MHRRQYLSAAGTASIALIAGCSGNGDDENGDDNGDDEEPTDPPTNGNGDDTGDDNGDDEPETEGDLAPLRDELEAAGIEIIGLSLDGTYITLDYLTEADDENDDQLDEEIRTIAPAFAEVVDEFDDTLEALEAFALTEDDSFIDVFEVRAEWARDYAAGDLSEDDYVDNVVDTLEFR